MHAGSAHLKPSFLRMVCSWVKRANNNNYDCFYPDRNRIVVFSFANVLVPGFCEDNDTEHLINTTSFHLGVSGGHCGTAVHS